MGQPGPWEPRLEPDLGHFLSVVLTAPSLTPVERGGRASALFALVMAGLTGFSESTFMWKWAVSCSNRHF